MKRQTLTILTISLLLFSSNVVILSSNAELLDLENDSQILGKIRIRNVDLVTITNDSAVITWTTNINCSTNIYYGFYPLTLEYHYSDSSQNSVCFHYLELDTLDSGTTYYYKVGCNESKSLTHKFTTLTPPSGDYLFSFATISDRHAYSEDPDSIILNELGILEINQRNVDFVIDKGDMGFPFNISREIIEDFTMPYYPVYGDNDFIDSSGDVELYLDEFDINSTYYSFDYMDHHFIILDTISRKGRETGDILKQEFAWLKGDLEENKDKKIMIFMHHPCSNKDIPLIMALNFWDGLRFRFIISRYNVVGVFSGHTHRNKVTHSFFTKSMPYVETSSSHKYPGGYNIYKVYTNGYMQSFYKINSNVTENKRYGEKEDLLSPVSGRFGFVKDRNFVVEYQENQINV